MAKLQCQKARFLRRKARMFLEQNASTLGQKHAKHIQGTC